MEQIVIGQYTFILRDANDDDKLFIFNLLKENMLESFNKNWGFWNEKSFEKTHRKETIRIIEYENFSIGYIDFKFKIDCGYVNDIQISEKFRNKGLGTYLMKMLEQETLSRGLKRICLKVFKDNKAVKLYQRLGYKTILEDDTSLIMEKRIV
jgi:ribosomal protein S18 acetylase RimI-like enzyme